MWKLLKSTFAWSPSSVNIFYMTTITDDLKRFSIVWVTTVSAQQCFFYHSGSTDVNQENELSAPVFQPDDPVATSPVESTATNSPPMFFRLFEFSPEVPIRLDYHGKHMDMGQVRLATDHHKMCKKSV